MRRSLFAAVAVVAAITALHLAGTRAHAVPAAPAVTDDHTVVAILELTNSFDIETGQLAAERAQRADVRAYGAMLARDHKAVRQQGIDLAERLQITPAELEEGELSIAHAAAMKKLRAASAAEFDRAFLQHEADYHTTMIKLTNTTLLPNIKNAELKAFVTKIAPAFEAHRAGAERLLRMDGGR
jgi:putative membrane protein